MTFRLFNRRRRLFTPVNFAGIDGWWDASDLGYLGLTSGTVTTWYDKGPNGRHVTEATNPPTWSLSEASTGLPGVTFNGTSQLLSRSQDWAYSSGAATVWAVLTSASPATSRYVISEGNAAGSTCTYAMMRCSPSTATSLVSTITNDAGTNVLASTPATGTSFNAAPPTLSVRVDNGSNVIGYKNGSTSNNANYTRSGVLTLGKFCLGARAQQTPNTFFPGTIHEIIQMVGRTPDQRERQLLEGYLAWKWGIQTSLPSTHPFASGPP